MSELHKDFLNIFDVFATLQASDKVSFLDELLFYFTITGRAIWSDVESNDAEKVEAFKWMNELAHRVWNIRFSVIRAEEDDLSTRLFENLKFYGEQSELLRKQLVPTTLGAFKKFEFRR